MSKRVASKSKAVARRDVGSKAVTFYPMGVTWNFKPAGTKFNYQAEVGNGLGSSVLVALLCWLMRTFPEAPCIVEKREEGQWRQIEDPAHDMEKLIATPNPFYSGRALWMSTVLEYAFGNAYWLKVRNGHDEVVELWWMPSALITPKWDQNNPDSFIDYYQYDIAGRQKKLDPRDVVHFRFGNHPENPRIGFTPLAAMVREIYVDDQASNFTASILRNLGIAGVVVSPETGGPLIPPAKVGEVKDYVQQNFTGDKRGNGMVFSSPTKVQLLQYNLQGFDVGPIRDIAEERCSAALGIPAAVVGFGTGLQQTKVGATMKELKELSWDACLIPMGANLASTLDQQLLPEFQGNPGLFRTKFDLSDVRALQEDEKQKTDRVLEMVEKSVITVGEGRRDLGYPTDTSHDFYLRATTVQAIPKNDPLRPTPRVQEVVQPLPDPTAPKGEQPKPAAPTPTPKP